MNLLEAYATLQNLDMKVFTTNDASTLFSMSSSAASHMLAKMSKQGLILKLKRGTWCVKGKVELLMLPQFITAPLPAYVSLQSALYLHGMISQISSIVYAVSIARTMTVKTDIGLVSIHHIQPDLFLDYEKYNLTNINLAIPEKALFDFCYLHDTKTHLFHSLPEIEYPKKFSMKKLFSYCDRIHSQKKRRMIRAVITKMTRGI